VAGVEVFKTGQIEGLSETIKLLQKLECLRIVCLIFGTAIENISFY
jgi:hypothetical protein